MKSRLLLIFLGVLFSFLSLEIFFRLVPIGDLREFTRPFFGQNVLSCRERHPVLDHVLIANCKGVVETTDFKNTFTTNSFGLKDEEFSKEKPKGVFRVLFMGDSFVEGWGVDQKDNFVEVTEEILKKKGRKIEIINAGNSSYSPILELEYLRFKGLSFEPDLVIMMVDPNDMHDEFYYGGWDRHIKLREELFPGTSESLNVWPNKEYVRTKRALSFSKVLSLVYEKGKAFVDTRNEKLSLENLSVDSAIYAKAENWEDYEKSFNLLKATIDLTSKFLDSKGVDFMLTTSSRGAYHSKQEWTKGRKVWGFEEGKVYEAKPVNEVRDFAEEKGISYIDIFGALEVSGVYPIYYQTDLHWTKEANRVVGKAVADYLEGWLDEKSGI